MWQNQSVLSSPALQYLECLYLCRVSCTLSQQMTIAMRPEKSRIRVPIAQVKPNLPRQVQRIQAMDLQAVGIPLLMMFGLVLPKSNIVVNIVINGKTLVLVCATTSYPLHWSVRRSNSGTGMPI